MRDYRYRPDNGPAVFVSQMAESDIDDILAIGGVVIIRDDGDDATVEKIMERLRIEKLIRALKL